MGREEATFKVHVEAHEYVMSEVRAQIEDLDSEFAEVEVVGTVDEE